MNVTGEKTAVEQFIADMSKPVPDFKKKPDDNFGHVDGEWEMYDKTVFSFFNIVLPEYLEDYFTGQNWYNWNIANWGVKWDAKVDETAVDQLDKGDLANGKYYVSYRFETAWGAPNEVFVALAEKYPHLEFDIEWEEEQGFGAELSAVDGEVSVVREWDIPSSHKDYVERDREDSCVCAYYDDIDELFDDCPPAIEANADENKLLPVSELTVVS